MFFYRIELCLKMNPLDGLPYYRVYENDGWIEKPYYSEYHIIPEEYRIWLNGRGENFRYLITHFSDEIPTISEIVENYPDFYDLENFEDWSSNTNNEFRNALEYFSRDGIYQIYIWNEDF